MVKVLRKAKVFFFNGIILTITSLIMRGAGLIFQIYVSNKIGTEAVGLFSLIMSVYMFAITIATSGISIAATCIISEELAKTAYNKPVVGTYDVITKDFKGHESPKQAKAYGFIIPDTREIARKSGEFSAVFLGAFCRKACILPVSGV